MAPVYNADSAEAIAKAKAQEQAARDAEAKVYKDANLKLKKDSLGLRTQVAQKNALKEAEEQTQVKNAEDQLIAVRKGKDFIDAAMENYRKTGKTMTWGQASEIQTDLASLMTIRPSAVVPIAREKKLDVDVPKFFRFIAELKTNITSNPTKNVPVGYLKVLDDQFSKLEPIFGEYKNRQLKTALERSVSPGLLPKKMADERYNETKYTEAKKAPEQSRTLMPINNKARIKAKDLKTNKKMSRDSINAGLSASGFQGLTKEEYDSL